MERKLVRLEDQKMIGGVCAGLGDYMSIDVSLVRLLFVAIGFITAVFPMVFFYIIAWIVIPPGRKVVEEEKEIKKSTKSTKTSKPKP